MVDVNKEVRGILNRMENTEIKFFHPGEFNDLPVISYYELTTRTGICYDNKENGQRSNVCIDIWGASGAECSRLAVEVNDLMQSDGWAREFSRDMPPEDGVYHKTMRFYKHIYF